MRRDLAARFLAFASHERGAVLWIPGLLAGTSLILFGIHQAPRGTSLFTHTTGVRVVVGPGSGPAGSESTQGSIERALRRGLLRHGSIELVDSLRVARRLQDAGFVESRPESPAFLQAMRALNPHLALRLRLLPEPGGVHVRLEALDVHDIGRSFTCLAAGAEASEVGAALADSVCAHLFAPAKPPGHR